MTWRWLGGNRTNYWWSRLAHKGEGDTESDRFTFSINGKSGVFRYSITDKELRTIPTSDIKIERISTGGFKITDTDGSKYYFTYGETNSDYNTSTLTAVTTWYITRIEPSTSTIPIIFSYTSGQGYTMSYITQMENSGTSYDKVYSTLYNWYDLEENQYYSDSYQSYGGLYHGTVLLSQISWAGNTISFAYAQDRQERGWNLDRLTSMTVKYGGQTTVRTVYFDNNHYLGSSQSNYRMMLEGLTIQGTSSASTMTYGFSYNNTALPNYFIIGTDQTCHEDYWGYYNGTHQSWIPSDSYATASSTSNRAANSYMVAGSLTSITYPTGGSTELVMEPNVLHDNRTWGGLRLNTITTKDANGSTICRKTYQYANGYPAENNIDDLYTYDVDYYYGYRDGRGLQWGIGTHTIDQSSPFLSLSGDWGHPVYYRTVTEFIDGLGKTVYTYDEKRPSLNNMEDNAHIYDPLRLYSIQYNFDQGTISPVLTSKTVYAQNGSSYTTKSTENYTYTEVTQTPFRLGVRFEESNVLINYGGIAIDDAALDNSEFHHEFIYSDVWAIPSFYHLTAKSVTDYDNKVTTTTTYGYDSTLRTHSPVTESVTVSGGQVLTTSYTYPVTDATPDTALVNANIHIPVKTNVTRGTNSVSSTRTTYGKYNNLHLPSSTYIGKGNNALEQRILYDYDSFGNLTYIVKDGTDKTVFLWGYQGLYPVAKIDGMTKAEVYSTLGNTISTLAGTPSSTTIHNICTTLGTSALVTTYTWSPLVGMTSMQSPRGEKTYFTYDAMGRLASIQDHNSNVIENYTYNYGTQSYVRRHTMANAAGSIYRESTDYYDGIGRKSETVLAGRAPGGGDLVTLTEYDGLNRPVKEWLPTVFSNSGGYVNPSAYTSATRTYYGSDPKPYSLTEYETCPSDKVIRQYGPGTDWQNNGKAVQKTYTSNTTSSPLDCRIYEVVGSGNALKCTGVFSADELFVIRTTDEDSNVNYTFTDKEGRLRLERRMEGSTTYDTYYVYDIYGNLTFVLPPLASDALTATNTTWSITSNSALRKYAYNYLYDSRNRCIQKKLPGCEYISMTYDTADRLVTRQDGVQRNATIITYYEYDNFGRQTEMGTKNALNIKTPLLKYFYDNYTSLTATGLGINTSAGSDAAFPNNSSPNARGLLTGTWTALLNNTSTGYYTSYYYGKRERLVQSHAQNHLGGLNDTYYTYNYIGTTATRKQVHSATGQTTQTELYSYTYDYGDRLVNTAYKLNSNSTISLGVNTYDAVGRLATHKPLNIETQTYGYNVRSWLTSITSTNFIEKLAYNTTVDGLTPEDAQYGGNIGAMQWKTGNETKTRNFQFAYTPLGWLEWADYYESGYPRAYDVYYYYDKMGNMTDFQRNGYIDDFYGIVDIPIFTYDGNRPTRIDDQDGSLTFPYNGGYHFIDYVQQNNEYAYDDNGNMTQDLNKRISLIQYNLLNLPQNITFSTGSTIAYTYDAAGRKLNVTYGSPSKTINYSGNMVYENGTLSQILTEGGYVTLSGTTPTYHAYLRDHQGNNRVVINSSGTIEQVSHYYPFGYFFAETTNPSTQRYKYNDKEFDEMHGLHWYDYGARHYDPAIMRFTTMDPMCEKYYHLSPYAYCGNNPVNAVDPTGNEVHPADSAAYSVILNTLSPSDRQFVTLDKNGNIDYTTMKSHKSKSGNYNSLLSMVGSDLIFNVNIQEDYSYMDNQGNVKKDKLTYIEPDTDFMDLDISSPSGLTTGETGKYGTTLLPGSGKSGVNSPNDAIFVYIHPSLSVIGKAEALSHEFYGHAYLYNVSRDRNVSGHHYNMSTDQNFWLRELIINARKETISYFKM